MKTLAEIYKTEGRSALKRLAAATGANEEYLYQICVNFRGGRKKPRRPSYELARRLIAADPRLTWDSLYPVDPPPEVPPLKGAA